MKRKVLSLVIALALCLNVCPVGALAADTAGLPGDGSSPQSESRNDTFTLTNNETRSEPYKVSAPLTINTAGYTLSGSVTCSCVILVTGSGSLNLKGTVSGSSNVPQEAVGVKVESGGSLTITETDIPTSITANAYALDIASGATVRLATGTYTGKRAAIRVEGNGFASLLAEGCAYFDANGAPITPEAAARAKTLVVGPCADHPNKTYTPNSNSPTHTWTCSCEVEGQEPCSFSFNEDGTGTCALCKRTLTITVDEDALDLVYNGTDKKADVIREVTLDGGTALTKDTDYTVSHTTRTDVGKITVTVTGKTFTGTFTKTYQVKQDTPGITWGATTKELDYDGRRTTETIKNELPPVTITLKTPNNEDLHSELKYSYRKDGETEFRDGLPLDAGKYEVKAYLEESQNYAAAETTPCLTLTINKIDPITTHPAAKNLFFNRAVQELVTPGALDPRAVGAQILFATSQTGEYSTAIPAETNAGSYNVWYKVVGTNNYNGAGPAQIANVKILRKPITPLVVLSQTSYQYDGEEKQPQVTVKDAEDGITLLETEYKVEYVNNRDVSTTGNPAKVVVTDQAGGNYAIPPVTVEFEITAKEQDALSITQKPDTVTYGDKFTLGTSGGSGGGAVTWEITSGKDTVATVDARSGQVTVTGVGSATVKATKSGAARAASGGNYEDATDSWTFTAVKKPVTATVTADDKIYDGNATATVHAVVAQSDLVNGDSITISGPTGTFNDADAGVDKIVTVTIGSPTITGHNSQHYAISYSSTTVKATIRKATADITEPTAANLTYNGSAQVLVTAATVTPNTLQAEYALSKDGPYSTELPKATQAGTYTVWYRVRENPNYTAPAPQSVDVTIGKKPVASPTVTLNPATPVYSGEAQEPAVTLQDGGATIPAGEYTVAYSDNVNAGNATVTVTAKPDGNYTFTTPVTKNFTISPKPVTPTVDLAQASFVYDGAKKTPQLTLRDGGTVIGPEQYMVTWADGKDNTDDHVLRAVGTYTGTIKSVTGGNYVIDTTTTVEITQAAQSALKITGQPERVYYGDTIRLSTEGGTENGTVTWSVTAGASSANIVETTGVLTVKGTGTVTVTAVRTVPNYKDVSAEWTFTVQPKPVTAVVTVEEKEYDGDTTANVTAKVTSGLLSGDTITITGLEGTYDNANAGTGKTVTLDSSHATATATDKYAVSYPATARGDITAKSLTSVTVTLSDHDLKTDASGKYYLFDGTEKRPAVTVKASDGTVLAASDYTVTYANNKNVGTASVTFKPKAGGNYTFNAGTVNFEIRKAAAVLTKTPRAKELTYNGAPQELVDVGTATGGTVVYSKMPSGTYGATIPQETAAGTYTVYYKVLGDANHNDTAPGQVSVTIKPREFTPVITLSPTSYVYDGTAHEPTVTVKDGSDTIVSGEYTVTWQNNINAGTATVIVSDKNGGNYIVNGTATFQITKADPTVTTPPTGKTGLQYTGAEQALVKAGVTQHGTVVYSVGGGSFSPALPTASARGTYNIQWKVLGDANHNDTTPASLGPVEIGKNTVTDPTINLSSNRFPHNGQQQRPVITVYDKNGRVIPEHEYTVAITGTGGSDPVAVGTYTITITPSANSNYEITGTNTKTFEIVAADQETISITGTRGQVYYGDVIQLGTEGGSGTGTVTWSITGNTASTLSTDGGLLTVKDINTPITVTATRTKDNYGPVTATWVFSAAKKPVTAVLTGVDKDFDNGTTATVKAEVAPGDLVFGDTFTIPNLTGTFDNANVGTGKTITITDGAPNITDPKAANYEITYPKAATASILKADIKPEDVTAPSINTGLEYTGSPQALLTAPGAAIGGDMVYSLDGANFTRNIPTAKDAGDYTVYFKAQGDGNHTDSAVQTRQVTIAQKTVTPNIELDPPSAQYTGSVQRPQVIVKDGTTVIPTSEYHVTYVTDGGKNWTDQGTYQVEIDNIDGGNYVVGSKEETFTISATAQSPLSITGRPASVRYGDASFTLTAVGGSGTGDVTWNSDRPDVASIDGNGAVTIKKVGTVKITATRAADANHAEVSADWEFTVEQKPATAMLTLANGPFSYTGSAITPLQTVTVEGRTLGTGEYDTTYTNNTNAGTATVTVASKNTCNYEFSATGTFTIGKATLTVSPDFTVTATEGQKLGNLTFTVPFNGNQVSGTLEWEAGNIEPTSGTTYKVTFTPTGADANNFDPANFEVTVTVNPAPSGGESGGGTSDTPAADISAAPSAVSMSMPAAVKDGTASAAVTAADGSRLVKAAAAKQSPSVVIKPEITGNVTKAEVSIPASTVKQIKEETSAALTVSAPMADVTIPRAALDTLGQAGGTVSVAAEQVDQGVAVTLTAGGETVDIVPGGLTVTVPAEDAGPGTVAMLVHEDGTRETIRKSVAADGRMNIPLDGSATVEIVDNSKEFSDVSPTSWASDAVAFASAHELFNGTSETTFSPDQSMSRGMLSTVLYNLEGRPDQDLTMRDLDSGYSDVNGDAWYADGVAWATENGIVNGYGNGEFGPNDSVTREQFVVMLWKYAGSPEVADKAIPFADADQASGYAREALSWAVEKGILNGCGDGRLVPGGTTTRAQAAQILKNFMERA